MKNLERYKKIIFVGVILIALGINFSTILSDSVGSLGTVFIAIGGLFFIIGMKEKKDTDERVKEGE